MAAQSGVTDGTFYFQADRGALYQVRDGQWHYVAGTMYGTLSPDERPTDLGVNDAGFVFRSTDTDTAYAPREFIWSGAEWVETTRVLYGTHAARPPADEQTPARTLYIETDRGNVVYENQGNAWKYVAGTMSGTIIAADQRPTGLGPNDTGFLFLSSDSTSVRWNGGSWDPLVRLFDLGPSPAVSQAVVKANGAGALSLLDYGQDNAQIGFDVEFALPAGWVARNATCAWITKTGGKLQISRASGATPGGSTSPTTVASCDLTTGDWLFQNGVAILGNINTAGAYQVFGNQVVGTRKAGIAPPSGGTTIDTQARAAIQAIINALSFAAGGHGLIG
jgi:hypothetical protein